MIIDRFRVDILGLSTDSKPETSVDGTTFYEVDTSTLYIYYKGTWYKQVQGGQEAEENQEEQEEVENG